MPYTKYLLAVGLIAVVGVGIFLFIALRQGSPLPTVSSVTEPMTTQQPQNGTPAVPSTVSTTQTASPSDFASSFYGWYLQGLAGSQAFTTTSAFSSQISNWLTPNFSSKWTSIAQNSGADPVLLSQDYANSWLTNISGKVISQTSSAAVIRVSLGSGPDLHQVDVHLISSGNSWRIDSVTSPN